MLREKHQRCVRSVARLVATSLTCWAQQRKLADTKHTDESGWAAAANAGAHLVPPLASNAWRCAPSCWQAPTRPLLKVITPNAATIFALVLRLRLRSASVQTIGRVRSVVPNHVGDL